MCTRQTELRLHLTKTKNGRARIAPLLTHVAAIRSLRRGDGMDLHGRKVFPVVTPRGILHAPETPRRSGSFPDPRRHGDHRATRQRDHGQHRPSLRPEMLRFSPPVDGAARSGRAAPSSKSVGRHRLPVPAILATSHGHDDAVVASRAVHGHGRSDAPTGGRTDAPRMARPQPVSARDKPCRGRSTSTGAVPRSLHADNSQGGNMPASDAAFQRMGQRRSTQHAVLPVMGSRARHSGDRLVDG